MIRYFQRLLPVCLAGALLILAWSAAAQSTATIATLNIAPGGLACDGTTFTGSYTVHATDSSGQPVAGDFNVTRIYRTSNGERSQDATQSSGDTISFMVDVPGDVLVWSTIEVTLADDPSVSSGVVTVNCADGSVIMPAYDDGRLNASAGDLQVVLYRAFDASGDPAIHVYKVDGRRGVYHDAYTYDLFAPYLNEAPAENTWLATDGLTDLYALATGEFQINFTTQEGKRYRVIFRGMPVQVLAAGEE